MRINHVASKIQEVSKCGNALSHMLLQNTSRKLLRSINASAFKYDLCIFANIVALPKPNAK